MLEKREGRRKACAARTRKTGLWGGREKTRVSLLYTVNLLLAEMGWARSIVGLATLSETSLLSGPLLKMVAIFRGEPLERPTFII